MSAANATPTETTKPATETTPAVQPSTETAGAVPGAPPPAPPVDKPLGDLIADEASRLRIMLTVEYTDHQNVIRPAVITKIYPNGLVNLVAYGVHQGDPATDMVCGVPCNPKGGSPNRWRLYL